MQVSSYTFQSPYPNQVQIGRPNVSSESDKSSTTSGFDTSSTDRTLQSAKSFEASQIKEVTPEVESKQVLDTYA